MPSCSCHTSFSRNETASAGSGRLPATATAIFARLRKFNLVRKFAMKLLQEQKACAAQMGCHNCMSHVMTAYS